MPVPGFHVLLFSPRSEDVAGRVKPGYDEGGWVVLFPQTGLPAYGIDAVRPPSTGIAWPLT